MADGLNAKPKFIAATVLTLRGGKTTTARGYLLTVAVFEMAFSGLISGQVWRRRAVLDVGVAVLSNDKRSRLNCCYLHVIHSTSQSEVCAILYGAKGGQGGHHGHNAFNSRAIWT